MDFLKCGEYFSRNAQNMKALALQQGHTVSCKTSQDVSYNGDILGTTNRGCLASQKRDRTRSICLRPTMQSSFKLFRSVVCFSWFGAPQGGSILNLGSHYGFVGSFFKRLFLVLIFLLTTPKVRLALPAISLMCVSGHVCWYTYTQGTEHSQHTLAPACIKITFKARYTLIKFYPVLLVNFGRII